MLAKLYVYTPYLANNGLPLSSLKPDKLVNFGFNRDILTDVQGSVNALLLYGSPSASDVLVE